MPHTSAAAVLAGRLVNPSVLDDALRSGLFLIQAPDAVCWAVFEQDLAEELEALGARAVSVDLARSDVAPGEALCRALRSEMIGLKNDARSSDVAKLSGILGGTLADMVEHLIQSSGRDLFLICDQLTRLADSPEAHVLMALKAARDRVNLRPDGIGRFIVVATDADGEALRLCAVDPEQAFFGAVVEVLPKT